ncbi:hypothetical protein AMS68_005879 [Peltaster fructicola]|uniref:Major facilitator superfamily (MFS) profile domain-containing protein n=1 Tax=Peltaster fructicola TaxID=286661 RepID=A0A6H0Y003_9PEZI|nr:hypothetical protein AMS68_005879 [Peltaster fructicola]
MTASSTTSVATCGAEKDVEKADDDISSDSGHEEVSMHEPGQSTTQQPEDLTTTTTNDEAFKVAFEPDDPLDPRNFSTKYKIWITFVLGMLALSASLGSSIVSPAEQAVAEEFGVSSEVTILMISLYVLGFCVGPLIWAPVSELFGRKVSMIPALVGLGLFSIGTALSRNIATVLVTRFFGGVFGSAPVSNVSAALGDIYHPKARGTAVTFYAVAVVGGPCIGPVIGAALTINPSLGWRWTEWIEAIWVFAVCVLAFFGMPEVYSPVLLKWKAQRLRKETGDQRYWHPHEKLKLDVKSIVTKHLSRPLLMLTTEPMVTCIAIYASFVYGLLYMTLEVFPIVFEDERHFGPVVGTLPFLGLFVGVICAVGLNLANQPRYVRLVDQNKGRAVPEGRLPPMIIGGWLFVIGLFLLAWTANPKIHWIVPVIATAFIGAGFNVLFQQCINFLVDTYGLYAASAVSANTFLRSLMACGLPLAAPPMYSRLGVGPATSILGGVAALALPVPFLFMRYGLKLRKMSKFAPVHDD